MSNAFEDFKSKRIRLFRNGDIYQMGRKIIVSSKNFRNFEQFLHTASVELSLVTGAARKIYSIEGKRIRKLDELEDNGLYVATSGEAFKRVPYPTTEAAEALLQTKNKTTETNFRLPLETHKYLSVHREESDKDDEEEPIFTPSSKAYIVFAYANGDARVQGTRVTLNHRNCRNFRQLLRFLSKTVYQTGGVRRLYDIDTGKQVKRLSDLQDGQNLACAGNDTFKNIKYPLITPVENAQIRKEQELRKVVTFYPNGDSYHTGYVVAILKSRFGNLGKANFINSQYRFVAGPIRQIFTTQGKRITKIEQFQNGNNCVLVSGSDPFISVPYNVNSDEVSPRRQGEYKGLAGSTQHNELMEMIRKPAEPQYSLLFKQQEEAMQAKLTKQHSRNRSMSHSSQPSEMSEAEQRRSKKEKKKSRKKKKKVVVDARIEESEAEEQDQVVQKRAAAALAQRKSKSKKQVAVEEEQEEEVVKPKAQANRVKVNSEPQIFKKSSRPVESETEPEETEDDIPEEPLARMVTNDKNVAYEKEVRQFNDQRRPLSDDETAPETSAMEETDAQESHSDGPDEESEVEVASPRKVLSQKSMGASSQKNLASGMVSPKKMASGVTSPKKVASGVISPKNAPSGVTSPKKVASKPELASPRQTKSVRNSQKIKSDTEEPTEAESSEQETAEETEAEQARESESEAEPVVTSKKPSQQQLTRKSVNQSQASIKKSQPSLAASETKLNQVTSKAASKKSLPSLIPKSSSNSRHSLQS